MKFPLPHKVKEGFNEDFDFTTKSGSVPSIQVNTKAEYSKQDTLRHLRNLKTLINNETCKAEDSDFTGDKYTHCNWGFCTDRPEVYNEPGDHIWPYDFLNNGRVARLKHHCLCPMDKRDVSDGQGCFYSCRIFKGPRPDKQEAFDLVNIKIKDLTQ